MLPESWKRLTHISSEMSVATSAPANIALIKYWGKKGHQLPANPSLSLTLKDCLTHSSFLFRPSESLQVRLFLDKVEKPTFAQKIKNYLESLQIELPIFKSIDLTVHTHNTFPHSSGIASSASSQAALGEALVRFLATLAHTDFDPRLASHLSRLASGSACRSIYKGFVSWGENSEFSESSDLYALNINSHVHPSLHHLRDAVCIVSSGEKEVSSRAGHSQMNNHPFLSARIIQAQIHYKAIVQALKVGEWQSVGEIMENEALTLHAMMMTSNPGYILLAPQSLDVIRLVQAFRREAGVLVYFTIDAGPNIHLIYRDEDQHKVETFIKHELSPILENVIWDRMDFE
jgi:diphosphomevalonate decarboxylase